LVIDDDRPLATLVSDVLRVDGWEVYPAYDGWQAIRLLGGGITPDLILLDMHMEGLDGWEFRAQLDRRRIQVPIVVATADPEPGRCAEAVDAVGYLAKPFDLRSLDRLLDQLVFTGTRISRAPPAA
jgi:CheY-like chemotaxis protein